jgi:hypothetical protein
MIFLGGNINEYRLFGSLNGPSSPVSYQGSFLAGVAFEVTTSGMWFEGYWWWVCGTGQSAAPVECALWSITSLDDGVVIPGSAVRSPALTAGQWNWIPLPQAVPIAIGSPYIAAVAVNGSFPNTNNQFAAGDTYGSGITNGPLVAYSDKGGSRLAPYGLGQGGFTVSGSDPTTSIPNGTSNSANFWVDVQVTDTAPAGYSGSYRLWPNKWDANQQTGGDSAVNYVVATEIGLTQASTLQKVWYYSPSGAKQLATQCDVYDIATRASVASITAPAWSGPAGSGWVSAAFSGQIAIPAGKYKVAVYNGQANPDAWSAKDPGTAYWATGVGANGITSGPLSAPGLATASPAYVYSGGGAGNTPPYSNGAGTQEPGQATFAIGGPQYPYLYVNGLAQNYWVDLEVTAGGNPAPTTSPSPSASASPSPTMSASPSPSTTPPPENPGAFLTFFE